MILRKFAWIPFWGFILAGCVAKGPLSVEEAPPGRAENHRAMAGNYEKGGELGKALLHLKIAGRLAGDDPANAAEIARVSNLIRQNAAMHFQRAQKFLDQKRPDLSVNELIKTLWYDPDHKEALAALKARPESMNWSVYDVRKGDTLASIAEKTLGCAENAFLLKGLNAITDEVGLIPGKSLIIPRIREELLATPVPTTAAPPTEEPEYVETEEEKTPELSITEELASARSFFDKKDFDKALEVVLSVKRIEPGNKDAVLLENAIYCGYARYLAEKNDFNGAERFIKKADKKHPCVKETQVFVKRRCIDESQRLYLQGVKHFVNDNLQEAIRSWQSVLVINPEHPKAQDDMLKAQQLLERLNNVR